MYVTSRLITTASAAAMPQAVSLVEYILANVNKEHGAELSAGVMVGGDPRVIGITGRYETLADYQALLTALSTDQGFQSAVQLGSPLFADMQDTIWQVRIAPGEPQAIAGVTEVKVNLPRVSEAMAFAAEAATTITGILGQQVGVATASTGDATRLIYVGYGKDLAEMEADNAKLEASEEYLDLFKRSEGLFAPGIFQRSTWMRVGPAA